MIPSNVIEISERLTDRRKRSVTAQWDASAADVAIGTCIWGFLLVMGGFTVYGIWRFFHG